MENPVVAGMGTFFSLNVKSSLKVKRSNTLAEPTDDEFGPDEEQPGIEQKEKNSVNVFLYATTGVRFHFKRFI